MKSTPKTTLKKAKPRPKKQLSIGEIYTPASKLNAMNVETPDSMFFEGQIALEKLQKFIVEKFGKGTTIDEYVRLKLEYDSLEELNKALLAEQIDSVAMAIYQIEKDLGIIVAHQTGIGKGRINAAIIRYACLQGKTPIVITEKESLFSDLFRDLKNIGSEDGSQPLEIASSKGVLTKIKYKKWVKLSKEEKDHYGQNPDKYEEYCLEYPTQLVYKYQKNKEYHPEEGKHLVPFIMNAKGTGSDISLENGNIIYKAPEKAIQKNIIETQELPQGKYDFILTTYSQIATGNKKDFSGGQLTIEKGLKANFVAHFAKDNIIIMDESHNASGGDSATGIIMREVVSSAQGVIFLSATFAKKPENMALYGLKTDLNGASLSDAEMATSIEKGGVALQEVVSSSLVSSGQLIRHERGAGNTGAIVNWIVLDKTAKEFGVQDYSADHRRKSDMITTLMNDIIDFQRDYVKGQVQRMDFAMKNDQNRNEEEDDDENDNGQSETSLNSGTAELGVKNSPYFSKVFNIVSQMLLAIKADAVADRAIQRLQEGKKPVITFANTMEAFVKELKPDKSEGVYEGDEESDGKINVDFSQVLEKGLSSTLKIQISDGWGKKIYETLSVESLGDDAVIEYDRIIKKIRALTTGIMISPIDYVKQKIQAAGFKVGEVTGRQTEVIYDKALISGNKNASLRAIIKTRDNEDATKTFNKFQNNEIDCLMINRSGSTGKSAHATPTEKVKAKDVKQRVMIVWQPELDINVVVQLLGRINRTGQILPPIYDYVSSNIPAEQRLIMMLKAKLKSLDANTTSSQKSSKDLIQSQDFLNKYGDEVMVEFIDTDFKESGDTMADDGSKKSYMKRLSLQKYFSSGNKKYNQKEETNKKGETEKSTIVGIAQSVTGRVALLLTTEQEKFYDDVVKKYQEFVQEKLDKDEYDLEVETMDLKAVSKGSPAVAIVGKHFMDSPFSGPTYLGMYEINNLRKPFSVKELRSEVESKLEKEDIEETTQIIFELLEKEMNDSIEAAKVSCERDIKAAENWLGKLKARTEEQVEKLAETILEEQTDRDDKIRRHIAQEKNSKKSFKEILDFFRVGRILSVPKDDNINTGLGVCLGVKAFNKLKVKRLYDIEIQIAVATGIKKVNFAFSGNGFGKLTSTMSFSSRMNQKDIYERWQQEISSSSKDRVSGLIVTGNLLQAFANQDFQKGRLIDFTLQEGGVKKGILMPQTYMREYISKGGGENINVTVPISSCIPILRSLGRNDKPISTNVSMSIFNTANGYFRFVISRATGGVIYTNRELLLYCEENNFNSSGDNMVAIVSDRDLQKFCDILSAQHGVSVKLTPNQFKMIKQEIKEQIKEDVVDLNAIQAKKMMLLRLRAKAIKIKALAISF